MQNERSQSPDADLSNRSVIVITGIFPFPLVVLIQRIYEASTSVARNVLPIHWPSVFYFVLDNPLLLLADCMATSPLTSVGWGIRLPKIKFCGYKGKSEQK